jgi:anti-sigma B factor antagonist
MVDSVITGPADEKEKGKSTLGVSRPLAWSLVPVHTAPRGPQPERRGRERREDTVETTRHEVNDGVVRLAVHGEIDLSTADDLHDAILSEVGRNPAEILVDLADVTFCDSTGIGAIVRAHSTAATRGILVQVINPQRMVHRVLEVTGLLTILGGR